MNNKYASVLVLGAVLFGAWFFRWDLEQIPNGDGAGAIFMLNRITGETFIVHGGTRFPVKDMKQ